MYSYDMISVKWVDSCAPAWGWQDMTDIEMHEYLIESIGFLVEEDEDSILLVMTYSEEDPNRFYYRSDQYNFAKNNIPVIFYFSGTHEDYHKPTDTVEKIEIDALQKRTQLVFYTAWNLAKKEEMLKLD